MRINTWDRIEKLNKEYSSLNLDEVIDYKKFYLYSIITHSTAIEGSTLTELDTQLLFDEGITAKGKPLTHHLMNEDLRNAYYFAMEEADKKAPITPEFLKKLNSILMNRTGNIHNTMVGSFDSSKGEYRLCGVTAGYGGRSYINYQKVPERVSELCDEISKRIEVERNMKDIYNLSFDAHFNLVTIHPWVDGNGRASRLFMNYMQFYNKVVPTKIFKEDRAEYITSLVESREKESTAPFREFMAKQHEKTLQSEISTYKKENKKNGGFRLIL
jgi:Uncharacterized conserved protein